MGPDSAPVSDRPVFLSYSRRDYYFAESLAFHLTSRGLPVWLDAKDLRPGSDWQASLDAAVDVAPACIVVGSPEAMASDHVRQEWTRACARGIPVVIAFFRDHEVPPELADAPVIDFRRSFPRALTALTTVLRAPNPREARPGITSATSSYFAYPPMVRVVAALLAVLSLFPLVAADYGDVFAGLRTAQGLDVFAPVVLLGVLIGYLWFAGAAFLRRRAGANHVAFVFAFFVYATVYPLGQYLYSPPVPEIFPEATMRVVGASPTATCALALVALCGLGIVGLWGPDDILRWTPTGKAWDRWRKSPSIGSDYPGTSPGERLQTIKRFRVVHDAADEPLANRLCQELKSAGSVETPGEDATTVLLVTGRTRSAWLESHASELTRDLFTVVGTGIGVPSRLDWLWRRQCLDFRRWTTSVRRHGGLIDVPEALTRVRLPLDVAIAHHIVCALAGLLFAVGVADQSGSNPAVSEDPSLIQMIVYVSGMGWGWIGHLLVNRTRTAAQLQRYAAFVMGIGLVGLVELIRLAGQSSVFGPMRVVPAGVFLVAAPIWLWRSRARREFWFPAPAPLAGMDDRLWPGRNWRTFGWSLLYVLPWAVLLGPPE